MEENWINEVPTPALVVDYTLMKKNIDTMAKFAKEHNIGLRPHIKTHKCPIIGKMQLEAGANGICVARVGEAEIFVENGFKDVLIANQVIDFHQIRRLIKLNQKALVRVCVDSKKNITDLNKIASKEDQNLEVILEVDVGSGRNGVKSGEPALKLANLIRETTHLKLVGLQGYEGHLISITDPALRKEKTEDSMKLLVETRNLLNNNGFEISYLTASNTCTYKFSAEYEGITELQPGTYIFNDEHHHQLSPEFDIAGTVLSTVSNNPGKRFYTIDAGLKAATNDNGNPIFKHYPKSKIKVMTEEHSIVRVGPQDHFEIGQKVELYPSHICTTVNLYDFFTVIEEGQYKERWEILARGKNY